MKEMICIICPRGCHLQVDENNGYKVTGNFCPRGEVYGREELKNPVRTVTSTVRVASESHRRCPVKTDRPIPKNLVFDAVKSLRGITLKTPVHIGQVVLENVSGTGANIIVTRNLQ
jgi:CxxC motif-containing protein